MEKQPLYSIGHGARKSEDFLLLLQEFNVQYLIDVRSQPYSKYNPQYNQNHLKLFLESHNITYVYMGDSLGGRPEDPTCYDDEGKVDYTKVKAKDFFLQGINRLKTAYSKNLATVIMCSESKPCECHRSKLIGQELSKQHIQLKHIDENGRLKDQATIINELNKGLSDFDLFGNQISGKSRKAYL
ncbi:DUF488 family protein [Terrimonas rubra]|uniref:DUF488 family protein n=1 Tax=Terrimonas rubra TaxID=1035890 RepID=A0ABW5ZZZ2_9BACT